MIVLLGPNNQIKGKINMLFMDYNWDLQPGYLKFDSELNLDMLGWKEGDVFILKKVGDQAVLRKVDDLEKFVKGYK